MMAEEKPQLETETTLNDELTSIEQLCDSYVKLYRQREPVSIEQFAAQHPRHEARILELLPTILMMEDARNRNLTKRKDGRVNRGPEKITELGDFRIIGELGRGGMGIVYEAHQNSLDRNVALKVLPKHALAEKQVEKFNREASVAANLHHTNIAPVYGVGEANGFHYFAMQLLNGQSMERFVSLDWDLEKEDRRLRFESEDLPTKELSIEDIGNIGRQVASALQYAHDLGVVHRDIKPSNLILGPEGHVWVTDFGLAISRDAGQQEPQESVSGTLRYIAPEKLDPTKFHSANDEASDIYALGITLIELCSGKPAFMSERVNDLIVDIQSGNVAPLNHRGKPLPSDLEAVLRKAVAVDPADRYATARELGTDLRCFSEGRPVKAKPNTLRGDVWRWVKRNPALSAVSTLAVLILIGTSFNSTSLYFQVQHVLDSERDQRLRAENASEVASKAIDKIFDQFSHGSTISDRPLETSQSRPRLSKESAAMLKQLSEFYVQLASQNVSDSELSVKAMMARCRVGEINERLGDYAEAATSFRIAVNGYRGLIEQGKILDSVDSALELARLTNQLGVVFRWSGKSEQAEFEHQRAIELLNTKLHQSGSDDRLLLELARSHYLIGYRTRPGMGPNSLPPPVFGQKPSGSDYARLELDQKRRDSLTEAVSLLDQIENSSKPEERMELDAARSHLRALCYRELAIDEWSKRTDADREFQAQAISLLEQLVQRHPHEPVYEFDLMRSLAEINIFDVDLDPAAIDEAYDSLQQAVQYNIELIKEQPDVANYRVELIHTHFKLGRIAELKSRYVESAQREELLQAKEYHYQRAYLAQSRLVLHYPDATVYKVWLARFSLSLAACETMANQRERQQRLVGRAISVLHELPAELSEKPEVTGLMAEAKELSRQFLMEPAL